jgi:hypothetical protein
MKMEIQFTTDQRNGDIEAAVFVILHDALALDTIAFPGRS